MSHSRAFLTILLAIRISLCFSQNDWRPGYLISKENDTIHGFIDYRPNSENSLRCFFREEEKGRSKVYNPGEITGYRYADGKFYVSKSIKTNDLDGTYFFEFLIKGEVNAYYLKYDDDLYFLEKDGELYLLKNTSHELYVDGKHYINEKKEYLGIMNYVLQDGDIQNDIMRSKLEHKQLIKISKKYHEKVCEDEECIIFEKKVKPLKVDFGIIAGSNFQTLYLNKDLSYEMKVENSFYGGVGFNFRDIPMIYERFSIHIELLLNRYYLENSKYTQFNIPFIIDYKLLAKRLSPRLEAGLSNYIVRNDIIKAMHLSLIAGISLHYEYYKDYRLFVHARYETNPGILRIGGGVYF